jgi:hypothetical protein
MFLILVRLEEHCCHGTALAIDAQMMELTDPQHLCVSIISNTHCALQSAVPGLVKMKMLEMRSKKMGSKKNDTICLAQNVLLLF